MTSDRSLSGHDNTLHGKTPACPQAGDGEALAEQVQHLMIAVESIVREAPEGVSELALIKALQAPPWQLIGTVNFGNPEQLYPVHFIVFHVLYRLREQLSGGSERLTISPLSIRLQPCSVVAGDGPPAAADPLRTFYLDLSQYTLSDDAITRMMDDFWAGRSGTGLPGASEARAAAGVFGFDSLPADFEPIKYRFRRAVMQAHPDRGGDTSRVQALNEAFGTLRRYFSQKMTTTG